MRGSTLLAAVAIVLVTAVSGRADNLALPPGPDRALVYSQCRTCHDLQYLIESAGIPRDAWNDIIDSMKQYGLRIPPDQRARILNYLGTYLGPNPPPKAAETAAAAPPAKVDGLTVYKEQCSVCHQPEGEGVPDTFPPLAGNRDLFLSADFPVRVVLFGMKGKIDVNGKTFEGEMPALNVMSDAQIAAVVAYVRGAWGNAALAPKDMAAVDAAAVAKLRQLKDVTPNQVHAARGKLKAGTSPR